MSWHSDFECMDFYDVQDHPDISVKRKRGERNQRKHTEIYSSIVLETKKACCFQFDDEQIWLPKSQIKLKENNEVEMPYWLFINNIIK